MNATSAGANCAAARSAAAIAPAELAPTIPVPGAIVLPAWVVDDVCAVPGGARPSYAHGYYDRDNDFYLAWDAISRDRDSFRAWMDEHVLATVAA